MTPDQPRILDQPVDVALQPILADLATSEAGEPPPRVPNRQAQWSELYEQIRPLGRGGMGRTILARDRSSRRQVCIKELFTDVDARMLAQEFRALSRLSHPNIERVFHVEPDASPIYMVAEFVEGEILSRHARAWPERNERHIASLMRPVTEAIAYAHAHNVIHRDLKPENILVEMNGSVARPVVLDLGLAIVDDYDYEERITAAGRVMGTAVYMGPEQFAGAVLTPAVDVYAIGVMLYELAVGSSPFRGSPREVFQSKMTVTDGLEIPDSFWRRRWRNIGPLVTACTRPKPANRPSARDVADALARL
jgi:serine/threonine protein kinase